MKISNTVLTNARMGPSEINTIRIGSQTVWERGGSIPTQTFAPETYGAVGNGIANDTAAFTAMHTAIIAAQTAQPNLRVTINFATNAHYAYTLNQWTWGIRYLTIEGNNATIQNVVFSDTHVQMMTWWTNPSIVENNPVNPRGFLINTVLAGSTSVTLKDALNAAEFVVGRWIIVASYSQQAGGWPPNPRYFDYAKVTSIQGGVISFDRPLVHAHRDDWITRGADNEIDQARIIPAEQDVPWCEQGLVRNLNALGNPNWPGGGVIQMEGFTLLEFENVNFPTWSAGQGVDLIFRNSTFPWSEPDKMLTSLRIEGCTCSFSQCSGVDLVEMVTSTSPGIQFMGRRLMIDGCTFSGVGIAGPPIQWWNPLSIGGFSPVEYVEVKNTTLDSNGNPTWPALAGAYTIERALGSTGFLLSGTEILVDQTYAQFWNYDGFSTRIYEGQKIMLTDAGRARKGFGHITSIRSNGGPFTARIGVNWSVPPVNGDIVIQYATMELKGINSPLINTFVDGAGPNEGIAYSEWNGELMKDVWTVTPP